MIDDRRLSHGPPLKVRAVLFLRHFQVPYEWIPWAVRTIQSRTWKWILFAQGTFAVILTWFVFRLTSGPQPIGRWLVMYGFLILFTLLLMGRIREDAIRRQTHEIQRAEQRAMWLILILIGVFNFHPALEPLPLIAMWPLVLGLLLLSHRVRTTGRTRGDKPKLVGDLHRLRRTE